MSNVGKFAVANVVSVFVVLGFGHEVALKVPGTCGQRFGSEQSGVLGAGRASSGYLKTGIKRRKIEE